jgi:hypothetical protein
MHRAPSAIAVVLLRLFCSPVSPRNAVRWDLSPKLTPEVQLYLDILQAMIDYCSPSFRVSSHQSESYHGNSQRPSTRSLEESS